MALLIWEENYSVGINKFDVQHKKMFNLINRFFDLMKEHAEISNLEEILNELIEYGKNHLKEEEETFDKFDYPDKIKHKNSHDMYRKRVNKFLEEKDKVFLSFDVIDFLEDWWLGHIVSADKKYTKFLNEKGLF